MISEEENEQQDLKWLTEKTELEKKIGNLQTKIEAITGFRELQATLEG